MLGRRGFFAALSACFAWMLPLKRTEAVVPWSSRDSQLVPDPEEISAEETNTVFGFDSGVKAGVKNAVVLGQMSIAEKSNVVMLGNMQTESLIVGPWEFGADDRGPYFFNRLTNQKYRLTQDVIDHPPSGAALGFGEHALKCGGPECPVGTHYNSAFGPHAIW